MSGAGAAEFRRATAGDADRLVTLGRDAFIDELFLLPSTGGGGWASRPVEVMRSNPAALRL